MCRQDRKIVAMTLELMQRPMGIPLQQKESERYTEVTTGPEGMRECQRPRL
jgi:hypothetical protein